MQFSRALPSSLCKTSLQNFVCTWWRRKWAKELHTRQTPSHLLYVFWSHSDGWVLLPPGGRAPTALVISSLPFKAFIFHYLAILQFYLFQSLYFFAHKNFWAQTSKPAAGYSSNANQAFVGFLNFISAAFLNLVEHKIITIIITNIINIQFFFLYYLRNIFSHGTDTHTKLNSVPAVVRQGFSRTINCNTFPIHHETIKKLEIKEWGAAQRILWWRKWSFVWVIWIFNIYSDSVFKKSLF